MINKFQKRGLGILRDILQIDPLRIPDQVELTDFTGVDFDFVQNCALHGIQTVLRLYNFYLTTLSSSEQFKDTKITQRGLKSA